MDDYFAVFGLARKLQIDGAELQRRFYELSRRHHPDFHQALEPDGQAAALEASALVNRAYRALRDPLGRIEYLIALEEGRETREGGSARPTAPQELLEEMLEVQEALEEAKAAGLDGQAMERLREQRQRLGERQARVEHEILSRAPDWDAAIDGQGERRPLLEWFKRKLATRAYLRAVIGDLSEGLGEEFHVAHRRH